MSTNAKENLDTIIAANKTAIDRSVLALMQELKHENMLLAESPSGTLQRALKIFRGIKPLLTVLSNLPFLPSTWRAALVLFIQALDSLTLVGPELTAGFKAGRDL
jgi:hypothetical protein